MMEWLKLSTSVRTKPKIQLDLVLQKMSQQQDVRIHFRILRKTN